MKKKKNRSEWEILKLGKKKVKVKAENFHHKMKKKTMFGNRHLNGKRWLGVSLSQHR